MKPVRSIATGLIVGPAIAFGFMAASSQGAHAAVTAAPAVQAHKNPGPVVGGYGAGGLLGVGLNILSPQSSSTSIVGGGGYGGPGIYGYGYRPFRGYGLGFRAHGCGGPIIFGGGGCC